MLTPNYKNQKGLCTFRFKEKKNCFINNYLGFFEALTFEFTNLILATKNCQKITFGQLFILNKTKCYYLVKLIINFNNNFRQFSDFRQKIISRTRQLLLKSSLHFRFTPQKHSDYRFEQLQPTGYLTKFRKTLSLIFDY
jgi:hypothetical protein